MAKKNNKKEDDRDATARRLDAVIRLLMDGQRAQDKGKKPTKNDQVLILDAVGLTDSEIGRIVGWPAKDVGSLLSKLRKRNKKK